MAASGQFVAINDVGYAEIVAFLYGEASLLDTRRFEEWIGLLADDMQYTVPLQQDIEGRTGAAPTMDWIDDDLPSLRQRVARYGTPYAYAEQPTSRTRRMITNICVWTREQSDEFDVICNLLVYRHRASRAAEIFCGERRDVLRKTQAGWRIARRTITLDQTALATSSLGILL